MLVNCVDSLLGLSFSGEEMRQFVAMILEQLIDIINKQNTPKTLLENTGE